MIAKHTAAALMVEQRSGTFLQLGDLKSQRNFKRALLNIIFLFNSLKSGAIGQNISLSENRE